MASGPHALKRSRHRSSKPESFAKWSADGFVRVLQPASIARTRPSALRAPQMNRVEYPPPGESLNKCNEISQISARREYKTGVVCPSALCAEGGRERLYVD